MAAGHGAGAVEIGQRSGDPQYPVVAPRRQAQPLCSALQEGAAGRLGGGDVIEQRTVRLGAPAMQPPIAAGDMLYVVTDRAELIAIR